MNSQVALFAAGTRSASAVGARITAFASGLTAKGWTVEVRDLSMTGPSRMCRAMDSLPERLRAPFEGAGLEGDVMPLTGWRARNSLRSVRAQVAIVSVPPFSLLLAAAQALPAHIPMIVDYRDPWSARYAPPPLARITRVLERRALTRAAAVTYAGGPRLGELLTRRLDLPPARVLSVPNGHDPADLAGVPPARVLPARNGSPLDIVFGGHWYGRNGPGVLLDALAQVGTPVAAPLSEASRRRSRSASNALRDAHRSSMGRCRAGSYTAASHKPMPPWSRLTAPARSNRASPLRCTTASRWACR